MLKADLRVEDSLGLAFEGKQADCLLLEFIQSLNTALAGWFEDVDQRSPDPVGRMQPSQHQGDRNGGGVGDDMDGIVRRPVSGRLDHRAHAAWHRADSSAAYVRSIR